MSAVMCDRHFLLLLALVNLASQQKRAIARDTLYKAYYDDDSERSMGGREIWHIWKDCDGALRSTTIDDDLVQLHQRGYIFIEKGPSDIHLTLKAQHAVQRFIEDRLHAMVPKDLRAHIFP